jgi:two-component system CheB/CheR fusion protein
MAEPPADRDLEVLLDYLRRSRGFDFTGYKRTSLRRRIDKRIHDVGAGGYLSYLDLLEVDPDEFTQLFNTILLNVTSFFRDPPTWDYLRAEVLPRLLAEKGDDEPVRIWSAGCASGEEAYTLAMVVAEALGPAAVPATGPSRSRESPRSCWSGTSSATGTAMCSPRSCGGRSSSAATT